MVTENDVVSAERLDKLRAEQFAKIRDTLEAAQAAGKPVILAVLEEAEGKGNVNLMVNCRGNDLLFAMGALMGYFMRLATPLMTRPKAFQYLKQAVLSMLQDTSRHVDGLTSPQGEVRHG